MSCGAQIVTGGNGFRAQPVEDVEFEAERAVAGIGDFCLDLAKFCGGETHLPRECLAVNERRVQRRGHQSVAVLRGDLDEISEHVVVANLETLHACVVGVARLHRRDHKT